jgi:peptide/nickel transport system substrate-binding protein
MTRRHFTQLGAAAAAVTATGLPGPAAAAQTPQRGGHVCYGVWGSDSGASFDPGTWGTDALNIQGTWAGVYNNLTEIAAGGELVGELAESFEASDDLKRWVFKLRKGVEFHNSKTLSAADVVASINHHRGDASTSAAKSIMAGIADIRADDAGTVVVTLHEGNADFAYLMSDYHLPIGAARAGRIDWNAHIGTGG